VPPINDDWHVLPFEDFREPAQKTPAGSLAEARQGTPRAKADPLSVSELTARLKNTVESTFNGVAVEGELSNCKQWSSGHLYFTLKDDRAQLRGVMFRTTVMRLKFKPEDGMRVIVRGRLSVYEQKGEYQIVADQFEPSGAGALQLAFEQLKKLLHSEGLFDAARKRALPVLPRRIGVVTSLDGAAVRDIVRVLTQRHPDARIVIRPARVQGEGAAADLIRALRAIVAVPEIDVVIIGRGGGSAEDLWAFNDEKLARAIAGCPVPVISAVGHEVDFTICDFVADVRAATPSNAAEIVVDRADNFRTRIRNAEHRLKSCANAAVERLWRRADAADMRLENWPTRVVMLDNDHERLALRLESAALERVAAHGARFEALRRRLEQRDLRRITSDLRTRVVRADGRLLALGRRTTDARAARAGQLAARLDSLSPLAVLGRGYAVCWNESRTSIIRSADSTTIGDTVRVTLNEGELVCRVEDNG
jgi:exodeoxyribonuclease VII large subunit